MNKKLFSVIIVALCVLLIATLSEAQDRRVSPSFPIGAGEKMNVYPGNSFANSTTYQSGYYESTSASTRMVRIILPVGTTLKRVLGDFVDQSVSNMTISLVRISNADASTEVVLRSFDTGGVSSSSDTDYKQVVSNPLSHSMLQGWTYYITVQFPGGTSVGDLRVGVIKLIYEP